MYKLIVIGLMCFTISSCSSLIYSPSIGLPVNPLKKGDVDIQGAFELFPETAPNEVMKKTTSGASLQIGYGFSDKNSLNLKGWISSTGEGRGGISLHLISQLKKFESARLYIIPKIGVALSAFSSGIGFELPLVYQYSFNSDFSAFGGFGAVYGAETSDSELWGWGVTSHLGVGIKLSENLRLHTELTGVYQNNQFDDVSHFIISPTIGLGYTFKKRK